MAQEAESNRRVLLGQRWRVRGESLSWQVVGVTEEAGTTRVELTGPGPLRGLSLVELPVLLEEWEYREPSMKEVLKVIDRVARAAMKKWNVGVTTPAEATGYLRELLAVAQGHLPSWMSEDFWCVEFDRMAQPSSPNMKVSSTSYTLLPTVLSGQQVEFYPLGATGGIKALLKHRNMFVVGETHLEAIIGLARLVGCVG